MRRLQSQQRRVDRLGRGFGSRRLGGPRRLLLRLGQPLFGLDQRFASLRGLLQGLGHRLLGLLLRLGLLLSGRESRTATARASRAASGGLSRPVNRQMRQVGVTLGESHRQLGRRVYVAEENIRDRLAAADAGEPRLHNAADLVGPRHADRAAGLKHHDGMWIGRDHRID